jgi:hypothetical protein
MRLVEVPVSVGGADDPVPAPGNHEQHALLGAQDDPGVGVDPIPRNHQVDPVGCADPEPPATADHLLNVIGPYPRGVDHLAGPHRDFLAGLQIANLNAGHPLALAEESGHPELFAAAAP